MIVLLPYCVNCGANYKYQASGNYCLNTPKEYNDKDYCPECKEAIVKALALIEKKSIIKWIDFDGVDLATLKRWKEEKIAERKLLEEKELLFPLLQRVFHTAPGYDVIHIKGREEHSDKFFMCVFDTNTNEIASLKTKVRVDLEDNILEYLDDD